MLLTGVWGFWREKVGEELLERHSRGLNVAEDGRTDGTLDIVGRLSQWCQPLGSANKLEEKREPGYTWHKCLGLGSLGFPGPFTSRVKEQITQRYS